MIKSCPYKAIRCASTQSQRQRVAIVRAENVEMWKGRGILEKDLTTNFEASR